MPFERAYQALNAIEEKLRRAFNLAGPIGAKLDPVLTPVILAGDLRDPGHANNVGRCWAWVHDQAGTPAGVNVVTMLFAADVLIEAAYCTGTIAAAAPMELYSTVPGETVPIAPTAASGAWRDRRVVTTDVPPITSNAAAWGALTGTAIGATNRLAVWRAMAAKKAIQPMGIMIPSGGTLTWRSTAANADLQVGCWGRIWP